MINFPILKKEEQLPPPKLTAEEYFEFCEFCLAANPKSREWLHDEDRMRDKNRRAGFVLS